MAHHGDDQVLPFELDRTRLRGRVARLGGSLEGVLANHAYPPAVSGLVAEACLLTGLIGAAMKLRWKLSLQIRGDGPLRLIATDYFAPEQEGQPARIRAYAGYDAEALDGSGFGLLGSGIFGILIDQGPDMRPYQGMTPLSGGSLAACAETYFAQSEQIATRFSLAVAETSLPGLRSAWRAGGMMLQQLPETALGVAPDQPSGEDGLMTADDIAAMGDGTEAWERTNILMATVEDHELIGPMVAPETLLLRLFHEEQPRVYEPQGLAFGCTCSAERVKRALAQYSARDIGHMTTPEGIVTADCQFCGAHYSFDPDELGFEAGTAKEGKG